MMQNSVYINVNVNNFNVSAERRIGPDITETEQWLKPAASSLLYTAAPQQFVARNRT